MRDILFRGKCSQDGEWVEGYLSKTDHEWIIGDNEGYGIYVASSTVSQYTGLIDKNGKKIFEWDIVKLFDIAVGEIVFECGAFGVGCRKQIDYDYLASEIAPITGCNNTPFFCCNDNFVSLWELYWNYNEESAEISVIEVIGNIYDNPELLEVSKQ